MSQGHDPVPAESVFRSDHVASFVTVSMLSPPRPARWLAGILVGVLLLTMAILIVTPWQQNAAGSGQIIALTPTERVQSVTSMLSGRIKSWHVQEGDRVRKGQLLVELSDNDPLYAERLNAELRAAQARLEATQAASRTANIDVARRQRLYAKGLAAKRDVEAASIRWHELEASVASAQAEIIKIETTIARQRTQQVVAPRDGTILRILGGDTSTFVKEGEVLVSFAPQAGQRAAEIFVSGLDAALIAPGQPVRLAFEGWPAVQFGGWPSIAVGTFPGTVQFIEPSASANGRFRVVVGELQDQPWPDERFLRLGGRARGWVLLSEVRLGYELWRRLNNFPPGPPASVTADRGQPATAGGARGASG